MALATLKEQSTVNAGRQLGRMARRRIDTSLAPITREASTNCNSLVGSTTPRVMRTKSGIEATPMAMMALRIEGPSTEVMTMASNTTGKACMLSTRRDRA